MADVGSQPDAENLRPRPTDAPTTIDGAQPDLHRVRVEQRHADVADVVGAEVHDHAHPVAGDEQPPLRADHRLGRVRRPAREDQRPGRVDVGLEARVGRSPTRGERAGSSESPTTSTGGSSVARSTRAGRRCRGSVMTSPQSVCCTSRSRCSPRRVWFEPDDRAARERRAAEREEVLRECCRGAPRRGGGRPSAAARGAGSPTGTTPRGTRRGSRPRSSKRIAGRVAISGSAALRRSSAAAFGGRRSGAWPGAGRGARPVAEPDIGVTLRVADARRRRGCPRTARRSVDGAGRAQGGDPVGVVAEHVGAGRRRCARRARAPCPAPPDPPRRPSPGTAAARHPSASVGNHSNRSVNCGSSATVLGVWHGAIGTSTSMPNCTHSAVDCGREDRRELGLHLAVAARVVAVLATRASARTARGGPTASQNFFQKCCSLAMNSTYPSVDAYTWYRTPPRMPAIAGSRRT